MPNPRTVIKIERRPVEDHVEDRPDTIKIGRRRVEDHAEDRPDTTLISAPKACDTCALRKGPACVECIDHALRGLGLVHLTPIVRH